MIHQRNVRVIALSGLLLAWSAAAFADSTADARKAITTLYNQQATALQHKNVKAAFSHLAPDYVGIDLKGHKTTPTTARQNLSTILGTAKSLHASVTVMQFSLKGNVAVATVKKYITAMLVDPSAKQPMTLVASNVSKDTWMKMKSVWLEKHSQSLSSKATLNGKPVPTS